MAKKICIAELTKGDLYGKRVLVRVDFNVPLDGDFQIVDDTRIRNSLPTIHYLIDRGARVILCTQLGVQWGNMITLRPILHKLSELIGVKVEMADTCVGKKVRKMVAALPCGGVLLLGNLRSHQGEKRNNPKFAKKLASLADIYVNDSFRTANRAYASNVGVTKFLSTTVSGLLMQKELTFLVGAVSHPRRPLVAIVGSPNLSPKVGVIDYLLDKVDVLLLGGRMIFTFNKANGMQVGSSPVEEDMLDTAKSLIEKARVKNVALHFPTDVVVADQFAPNAASKTVAVCDVPYGWMGLDIGSDTVKAFSEYLDTAKTVVWNGSMGEYNMEKFVVGTDAIAKKLADLTLKGVITVVGGTDSIGAMEKVGQANKMWHVSTGGAASMELLEGKSLPGVHAICDPVA